MRYFFLIFGRLRMSATSSICPGTRRSRNARRRHASIKWRWSPWVLRRLLINWFVSRTTLSTASATRALQSLLDVSLDLGVRHGRDSASYAVHDFKPGLPLGAPPRELLRADDSHHWDARFLYQHSDPPALDLLHDLAQVGSGFQGRDRLGLDRRRHSFPPLMRVK